MTETDEDFLKQMYTVVNTKMEGPGVERLFALARRGAAVPDLIGAQLLRDDPAVITKDTTNE